MKPISKSIEKRIRDLFEKCFETKDEKERLAFCEEMKYLGSILPLAKEHEKRIKELNRG